MNTWLELQNTLEDDKFPNTSSPCDHLETDTKNSNFPLRKQEEKPKDRELITMDKSVSLGEGKGVITRGLWDSSSKSGLISPDGINPVII